MFKYFAFVLLVLAAVAHAEPKPGVFAYTAPVVTAAPSAAVWTREYHGNFAAPYVAAPYVPAAPAPYLASPYVASPYFASPYAPAYTAPLLLKK